MAIALSPQVAPFAGGHVLKWSAVTNGQQGVAGSVGPFQLITCQVSGTFGAGGTITIEGSNDNTNWAACHTAGGVAATVTAAGLVALVEIPLWIRPNCTAGDGTTSLLVIALAVGNRA